jgi:hypothetical protein
VVDFDCSLKGSKGNFLIAGNNHYHKRNGVASRAVFVTDEAVAERAKIEKKSIFNGDIGKRKFKVPLFDGSNVTACISNFIKIT